MTKQLNIMILDIMYENGNSEVIAVTPKQWAGKIRTKGYKKTILSKKVAAQLTIKIKTK